MVNTLLASGDNSATWLHVPGTVDPEGGPANPADSYLSVTDWVSLPANSRLKAVLNKTYPTIAAFMAAWAGLGGSVDRVVRDISNIRMPVWFIDEVGYPKLYCIQSTFVDPSVQSLTCIIKLSLAYSASE